MSYQSPIKLITDLNYKLIEDQERNIVKAVCSYGIDISKDELFKLLYDDRKQYDKGFSDGYAKAKEDIVRCKDCAYAADVDEEGVYCSVNDNGFRLDDFCSLGEPIGEVEE